MTSHWVKDLVRVSPEPIQRLNHPFATDSAFDWPSKSEAPCTRFRPRSTAILPKTATSADYLEAVNLLEDFDDVENAALDEVERFQASRHRSPMLDELDDAY